MAEAYTCDNCGVDFGYPQGLSVHKELGCQWGDEDDSTDEDGESLSVEDAADIWLSHGMDEDYTFGYDEGELRRAADLD